MVWTKEKCILKAQKYKRKTDWCLGSRSSYDAAKQNGWFEECTQHMDIPTKAKQFWTLNKCDKIAFKYTTRAQWKRRAPNSYYGALHGGFLDECCIHMKK